ncbi:DUF697 domain-containing protein [Lichenicoccus roseus]|uniref:DUF697 domain-containing protein n=1 Tax=Lichenicoccus roseus TaxID=2683649 RepID=UPI001485F7FD|nr:DUF697 domain-containing protein [Lichenicoccus roseus]
MTDPGLPTRILPRIEAEPGHAARLEPPAREALPAAVAADADPVRWSTPALTLGGAAILALGLAALQTGNFVAAEFDRGRVLGWITLAVAVLGFGLILSGVARELRSLLRLRSVDRLRQELASGDALVRTRAARRWLQQVDGGEALLPSLAALNDPDAIVPLLRAGVEARLRAASDTLGRRAALQVVAGMAATPAPSLVVVLVSWRGLRLIRQVAAVYGMRPGLFGTLALLRRSALAAGAAAVTEVAVNTVAHAALSTPLLAHLAGEMAGGAVAARRMTVLARATAVACSPLPPA